ncbi:MAG TPA: carbon-nitrogen hydrolase family protein [bacterium]|uniref:Nitrilase n=1 Tax=candidate division TA06 bacterium ADurb.Bin417 TaxID=1852828 RepID=A0A1V5MMA3_UNCT6|nr:MAG: Nitrilase [candidate division TA06 bacterium ADurb.Bin417]HNS48758.1 carbon-nitrogen hydrolase family protein [bacterium]
MAKNIRIGVCSYSRKGQNSGLTVPEHLAAALDQVRQAAAEGAELAVLPEGFAYQDGNPWVGNFQPLDGPVVSTLAAEAKRLGIFIAAGQPTRVDGKKYNSIVLLDRRGELAGLYHKAYPTIGEMEDRVGIRPGPGPVVVETEIGRIGFAICYDLNFAELRLGYRDLKPDLILFCSAFRGGLQSIWWAYETRSYLVASVLDPAGLVVNPVGRVLARTDVWSQTATVTVNLDRAVVHLDYSNRNLAEMRRRYGKDFDFEWAEAEGVMLVTGRGKQTVAELMEAAGWEPVDDYFDRARRVRQEALAGRPVKTGPSPW